MCLVFYILMTFGHYSEKKGLEHEYPYVVGLTGDPASWNEDEKRLMASVLLKCKKDNESGDNESMKNCWAKHAEAIQDNGKSSRLLDSLLNKQQATKK